LEIVVVVPVPVIPPGLIVQVPDDGRPWSTTLPVVAGHDEGCVMVPIIGAVGAEGALLIITSAEECDVQPAELVTSNLYVPGRRFEIVAEVPVPAIAPGLMIHVPLAGRPLSTTLPVVARHDDGCVIVPIIGAVGAAGAGLMMILADISEIQPDSLVTLK
jgi:hypothetical protein